MENDAKLIHFGIEQRLNLFTKCNFAFKRLCTDTFKIHTFLGLLLGTQPARLQHNPRQPLSTPAICKTILIHLYPLISVTHTQDTALASSLTHSNTSLFLHHIYTTIRNKNLLLKHILIRLKRHHHGFTPLRLGQ